MSAAAAIPLFFKLPPTSPFHSKTQKLHFPFTNPSLIGSHHHHNFICFSFSPSNYNSSSSSSGEKPLNYASQDEARWLREEQRWLREEQRWLRQESRWNEEREALSSEIQRLKIRIQELERINSVQLLKEGELAKIINRIPESGSSAQPFVLKTTIEEKDMILKEIIEVPQQTEKKGKKRATLKIGSEGEDVRSMQEALLKLGFYSGEEDMEFSSFSSGTERAVKTWQSTLGAHEDGIMTSELLELLYEEKVSSPSFREQKKTNGTPLGSGPDTSEAGKTAITAGMKTEVELTEHQAEHRVYLLGENRWEEPSKLSGRNKQPGNKMSNVQTANQCPSCRGEGKVLCMECEGTGEPNIEPQFVEWIGEGAQCAYCDGLGFLTCDVCDGRKLTYA